MIGSTISHYDVVEEIGRGGMGVVYRATDNRLGRTVALKFLADHLLVNDNARDRFMQEARSAASLSHPNIATLHDIGDVDDRLFLVMEFVDGVGLDDLLADGPIEPDLAISIITQIANGLTHAHGNGIIHRDVKPANIKLTPEGVANILDFGLAKISESLFESNPGSIAGTAAYMSPEQIRGEQLGHATDLWSLGVVFYELLTGQRPFIGDYDHALYYSILNVDPLPVTDLQPGLPKALDRVVATLLAKEASDRYTSGRELCDALREPGAEPHRPAVPPTAVKPRSSKEKHHSPVSSTEERRQLTVVYCELEAFGDLADATDPEDLLEISESLRETWTSIIEQSGGYPGQYVGGTLYGYFGYPAAHEHDARRALSCGVQIVEGHGDIRTGQGVVMPPVRVGIHTGIAIVGEDNGQLAVHGTLKNTASLIAEHARSNSVVATHATHQLVGGYFDYADLGEHPVKGFSRPMKIVEVTGESGAHTRLDFIDDADLSPFVGRDVEVALLKKRWTQAGRGEGSSVVVSGEAGIGKSRLVDTFTRDVLRKDNTYYIGLYCSAFRQGSALHPFIEYLSHAVWPRIDEAGNFDDVKAFLADRDLATDKNLFLIANLLDVTTPDSLPVPNIAPAAQKQSTFELLLQIIAFQAAEKTGLIVIEDLHWADPSTRSWIEVLVSQVPAMPLLVLFTTRPSFHPDWTGKPRTSEVNLERLEDEDLVTISEHRSGKKLPAEILQKVVEKTDGVPLFVEELTKMILESGILVEEDDHYVLTGPLPDHAIPDTLQASLIARLDRLENERYLAEVGAVIGRQFSYDLVKAVCGVDDAILEQHLSNLVDAEIIFQRGFFPKASFIFKHSLIQDAAYNSILKKRRALLHASVAEALQESGSSKPELIAYHLKNAGRPAEAISSYLAAGHQALTRYENSEAVEHLSEAKSLISLLPESEDRAILELNILVPLGHALNMSRGHWGPEGEQALSRASELSRKIDAFEPLVFALIGLGSTYLVRGEYSKAHGIAMQAREAVERSGKPENMLISDVTVSAYHLFRGEYAQAQQHAEAVMSTYIPELHDPLRQLGTGTLSYTARLYRLVSLQMLGESESIQSEFEAMILEAENSNYHFDLYMGSLFYGLMLLARRDLSSCRKQMDKYLVAGREYGDPFPVMITTIVRNLTLRSPEEKEEFKSAKYMLDLLTGGGYGLGLSLLLGEYAAGLIDYGEYDEADAVLQEAVNHIKKVESELWEPEVYRLMGDVRRLQGSHAEAEEYYRIALDTARRQDAKLFELRSASSLISNYMDQGQEVDDMSDIQNALQDLGEDTQLPDVRTALDLLNGQQVGES